MKTKKMFVGTLGVLFMLSLMGGTTFSMVLNQNTAEMLYEDAMLKKDGDGNLPAAIKLFQQILTEFPQNRKIAGQAQLQIGLCYEKLGESEALKAYEKVISDYADQSSVLKTAKARLAFLETKKTSPQTKGDEFSLRKVSIPYGEPSPDGKYVAYENENEGLSLYEMSTGNKKEIVVVEKDQPVFATLEFPGDCWSPSGNQIAYMVWHTPNSLENLHIIDKSGSNHRLLFSNIDRNVWGIAGWTPDEKYIVVSLRNKDRSVSYVKISTSDGHLEELFASEILDSWYVRLSPDGKYLAYNFSKERNSISDNIRIYSFDRASHDDVIMHPAYDELIGWTPDGGYILFVSDRTGDKGIWAQSIKNGIPVGDAKLIKTFSGRLDPMGFTNDGAFYLEEYQGGEDVYTAQVDMETGKTIKGPEKIEEKYSGFTTNSFWSNDGKYLGYFVRSDIDSVPRVINKLRIFSMENGSNRDIIFDFSASQYNTPKWSADGKSIFITGSKDRKPHFFKLDIVSGKHEILLENAYVESASSDGRFLYKIERRRGVDASNSQNWIIRVDTKTGTEIELFRTELGQRLISTSLSPDEKWIGFSLFGSDEQFINYYTKICVLPAIGGEVRELYQSEKGMGVKLFWDSLSKGLLFLTSSENKAIVAGKNQLWYISSLESKSPRKLDLEFFGLSELSFHPDGKTITFSAYEPPVTDIWVMENYLPKDKT